MLFSVMRAMFVLLFLYENCGALYFAELYCLVGVSEYIFCGVVVPR